MGALGLALGLVGFLGLLLGGITTPLKSSWAYSAGVARAVADPRVRQALGEPVVPGWVVTGSVSAAGARSQAQLSVPLEGATRPGRLKLAAHATGNSWQFDQLQVAIDGAPSINLLEP